MRDAQYLRAQAKFCLEVASQISDLKTVENLQADAASRQSQAIADQTKELGQKIKNGTTGAAARPSRAA